MMKKRIGFVSTRFAGTDGVTLEANKWAEVLAAAGHRCFWFAGRLDRSSDTGCEVPEAFFQHPDNEEINRNIFGRKYRSPSITDAIQDLKSFLKSELHDFIAAFQLDMLIAENALTIPMHVPLGLALTETIVESGIPTIAHHHDFYWERPRFFLNAVGDYLRTAFPPNLHGIEHVVINSLAQEELALRTGISSSIIPNVLDFDNPPTQNAVSGERLREAIGLAPEDIIILQPTRIVPRKGIEHAVELVHAMNNPRIKLVISHEGGDEGMEYAEWLTADARKQGVDIRTIETMIRDPWKKAGRDRVEFSLWDIYPHADFITYPSLYEGFGNAFLEAVYFRKPLLVNRYAIFIRDIEPMGFDLAIMDGFLTRRTIDVVRAVMENPDQRAAMVEKNFEVARRHYSYAVLRNKLNALMINFFGMAPETGKPTELTVKATRTAGNK
jgi:glycosyltransferase involved in cell wall biosynthesis